MMYSEIMAASEGAKDALYYQRFLCELGLDDESTIASLAVDNTGAIDQLAAAGQNVTAFRNQMTELEGVVVLVNGGCRHLRGFFDEMMRLYLPAILCVVAIVFAFVVNQTLCCATGCCCRGPPTEEEKQEARKSRYRESEMTNIAVTQQPEE